jgi:signal transduction histidine kinase
MGIPHSILPVDGLDPPGPESSEQQALPVSGPAQQPDQPPARSFGQTEALFEVEARDDQDLASLHRRTRQVAALLGFDISQQTEIGTAIAVVTRSALIRAALAKVEFSATVGAPGMLCIRIQEEGATKPGIPEEREDCAIRIARELMDEVQIQLSDSGQSTAFLGRRMPRAFLQDHEEFRQLREKLERATPKTLVQELRDQNRELREMHQQLVRSEISLRQRIRQSALMADLAAVLIGSESLAAKLPYCSAEIIQYLEVDCASIWTTDSAGQHFTLSAAAGDASGDLPQRWELGNSQFAHLVRDRTPYLTNSLREDFLGPEWNWAARHRIQASAGYPLAIENKLMGVLAVYSRRLLGVDVLDTLRVVANQLAVGIERQERIEERERLLGSEHEARLKAERATQSRERLLAVVSHDLRNPLSSVVTAAALLDRSPALAAEPRLHKHVDTIFHASDRMKRLLSDLLDLASLESGRLALSPARQSVAPLISESMELHSAMAEAKLIRLESKVDDFLPEILCDHGRILQVLSNLIGNAIKFTPEGGAISVRAFRAGCDVAFAVSDSGPGMSQHELSHVFETYWQASPSRGQGGGMGLGLSIAKGLVEAQGGRIRVESTLGEGSTFVVTLPAQSELPAAEQRFAG